MGILLWILAVMAIILGVGFVLTTFTISLTAVVFEGMLGNLWWLVGANISIFIGSLIINIATTKDSKARNISNCITLGLDIIILIWTALEFNAVIETMGAYPDTIPGVNLETFTIVFIVFEATEVFLTGIFLGYKSIADEIKEIKNLDEDHSNTIVEDIWSKSFDTTNEQNKQEEENEN